MDPIETVKKVLRPGRPRKVILEQPIETPWPQSGDFALVTPKNDIWYGFKVTIVDVVNGWATCDYSGQRRSINIKSLANPKNGFRDFIYDK
jgi:hypothetical protein